MIKSLVFVVLAGVALACERDCQCGDFLYSECKYPFPVTEVHALTVEECKETCDLFASFNQCNFYSFTAPNIVDENCKIFADESLDQFLKSCNLQGQPLKDQNGNCFYTGASCPKDCVRCDACASTTCDGYVETDCQNIGNGNPAETNDKLDQEGCRQFCYNLMGSSQLTFMTFTQEQKICSCFQSGARTCKTKVLSAKTDLSCVP